MSQLNRILRFSRSLSSFLHASPQRFIASAAVIATFLLAAAASSAATITVPAGGDLQAAINAAACGDEVVLQSGAAFSGNFVLRYKGPCTGSDADYITIRTSNLAALPAAGTRITPAYASVMAKLVATSSAPVLEAEANAHHYKLIGLEITNVGGSMVTPELVLLGARSSGGNIPFAQHPHHFTFDRCWVHEAANDTVTLDSITTTAIRGFNVDATDIRITECRVAGFRTYQPVRQGVEASNAILFPSSALRVTVNNTYLEAWFAPLFLGGSGGSTPNSATVSNASLTRATLSNAGNLSVGDLIALKVTNGHQPAGATCSNCNVAFQIARVTAVNGNTVDYVGQYNQGGSGNGGNPLLQAPDSPGLAQWNGYLNQDILVQRCQFVINYNATEQVWTSTGGSSTTLPRSQQTSTGNAPKGQVEIKMARNLTLDGNTFEGWHAGLTITSRNQGNTQTSGGFPWASVENLRITNNWWKRSVNSNRIYSMIIGGPQLEDNEYTSKRGGPLLIANNLFDSGANEMLAAFAGADNVTIVHNTYPGSSVSPGGSAINGIGVNQSFVSRDNILPNNEYGIQNCQYSSNCWPNKVQTNNVIIDNRSADGKIGDGPLNYPNNFVATQAVSWIDPANANYRLTANSPYKGHASDGKDPGVDMDALLLALSPSASSSPTPTPTPTVSPTPLPTPTPTPGNGMTSTASVLRAKDHATVLAGQMDVPSFSHHAVASGREVSTSELASNLDALTNDILLAHEDFAREANLFGAIAPSIETHLSAALLFSRANAAVAFETGNTPSVAMHLNRIVSHLTMTEDLMLYGSISEMTADQANAARARIDLAIGDASTGYNQPATGVIAPSSLSLAFGGIGQTFCIEPVFALSSIAAENYEVGGVSVSIGSHAAQVVYVSPARLAFVVPAEVTMGSAEVIVVSQDGYLSRGVTTLARNVFRLMTENEDGSGDAIAMNLTKQTSGFDVVTPENFGTDKRTRVALFAVGITAGATNSDIVNDIRLGAISVPNFAESVTVEARLSNGQLINLPVEFAGSHATMIGLDQVNVRLTPELRGAGVVTLTLLVGGQRSNSAPINIR